MMMPPRTPLPLSSAQHGIWLGQQLAPESPLYNVAEGLDIEGPLQVQAFCRAVLSVLSACEAIHQRFEVSGGEVRQVIAEMRPTAFESIVADEGFDLPNWIDRDLGRAVDLTTELPYRSVLFELSPSHYFWYLRAHHIVLDGSGFAWIRERVMQHYRATVEGRALPVRPTGSLAHVIEEDRAYRASAAQREDLRFWTQRFADQPIVGSFSSMHASADAPARRRDTALSSSWFERLRSAASSHRVSWIELVTAAVVRSLRHADMPDDVVLGMPMMGPTGAAALRIPCMSMNIVPIRVRPPASDATDAWVRDVARELKAVRPHARYRYEQLRRDLRRVGGDRRLFGPVLNILPWGDASALPQLTCTLRPLASGPIEDIAIGVWGGHGHRPPKLRIEANPQVYRVVDLEQIEGWILAELEAMTHLARATGKPGEPEDPGRAPDVLAAFEQQVAATPHAIAVEHGGEVLSYAGLQREAHRIAHALRHAGIGPECRVAMALPRSITTIATILGTLMLGATYLPLDPEGPADRNARIVSEARPHCIATTTATAERFRHVAAPCIVLDACSEGDVQAPPRLASEPGRLAYLLYTSGSTGAPQGVMVHRDALAHFIRSATARYAWKPGDRVLQFAPFHFDASVEEVFVSLCNGATLVLRDDAMMTSLPAFVAQCDSRRITVLDLPTAFWHELAYALAHGSVALPPSVHTVIIGGEAALSERVHQWQRAVAHDVRLLNTYGPTETTVVVACAELQREPRDAVDIPIGRPLPGITLIAIDGQERVCLPGETGELCVLGPTLARGYWNHATLTEQRFFRLRDLPGAPRAYRTGDRARRRSDGQWLFMGRIDDEVKISGQRVHPREIEAVLVEFPGVIEAAVVVTSERRLVAFVAVAHATFEVADLLSFAQTRLLAAAVPTLLVRERTLPKNRSGKIDRRMLARAAAERDLPAAPQGEADPFEHAVLAIWREVLGRNDLARDDDVFDRGGHSLQTIQVANRLSVALAREIPVSLVFRHPTVASLTAALLSTESSDQPRPGDREVLERDAQLAPSRALRPSAVPPRSGGEATILFTGATGFIGAHLLYRLLTESTARLCCLVRARHDEEATDRLHRSLAHYGLEAAGLDRRVDALAADLAAPRFGCSAGIFEDLASRCDLILHNAAIVNLVRPYGSLRRANVESTRQLLEIAMQGTPKPFFAVSTLAVGPRCIDAPSVDERFFAHHEGLQDGYTQSKWVSERLIAQAFERGLTGSVLRLGRVVGPRATGYVNPQDILWRLLRVGLPQGLLPAMPIEESWIPVDDAAGMITSLVGSKGPVPPVMHLAPTPPVSWTDLYIWLRSYGYVFDVCPLSDWHRRIPTGNDAETRATLAFFDRPAKDSEHVALGSIRADHLRATLPGFSPTPIDEALVHRYLRFCVRTGLLPAPTSPSSRQS